VDNPALAEWLQLHGFYFLPRMKCGLLLLQIHDQALDLIHRDIVRNAPLYPAIPFDCLVNLDALLAHARLCRRGCQTTCDLQRYRYLVGSSCGRHAWLEMTNGTEDPKLVVSRVRAKDVRRCRYSGLMM
jgi:hypothetical protein